MMLSGYLMQVFVRVGYFYILISIVQVNLQMSVLRLQIETKLTFLELDNVSRGRHGEVLEVSQMSEKERQVRAFRLWFSLY